MKMYTVVLVILLLTVILSDIFFYFRLKDKNARPFFIILHLIPAVFFISLFLYIKFGMESSRNFRIIAHIMWLYFVFFLIYIPKVIHIVFYMIDRLYTRLTGKKTVYFNIFRIVLSALVVILMFLGAYVTPRNFEVTHVKVPVKNLPAAFNGYKIVQISDLHLGSWNDQFSKLEPVIRLVNQQHPDIIVFTGDMVNNYADEAAGWTPYFLRMKSVSGKYAILGNHDYGDYSDWKTAADKAQNKQRIRNYIRGFGFHLLLNEHIYLHRGSDSLALVGVENWGKSEEYRYSNLSKAVAGCDSLSPKILLSHDPNQWDAEILKHKDIALTLSGHTHAAQLGLRIGHTLITPAALVFKEYAGLYNKNNQYIYVNRGIGYIGLPMQIGVRPEITVIQLVAQ